jgi:hypothetical protein
MSDFVVRLIEESARTDDAWILFRSIETDCSLVQRVVEVRNFHASV